MLLESLIDLGMLSHARLRMRADRTSPDAVVDQALEVVEEYQGRILKIEQAVLLKPSMKTVRRRESGVFPNHAISG